MIRAQSAKNASYLAASTQNSLPQQMCARRNLSPERRLELLHTLVTLAADTAAVRDAIKALQADRDALTLERFELRKSLKQAERDAKAAASSNGAAAKSPAATAESSGGASGRGDSAPAKARGGGAAAAAGARGAAAAAAASATAAAEQEDAAKTSRRRLGELEESVAEHGVRHAPHLGCDRRGNDYFCIAAPLANAGVEEAPLCVLCHEYAWVRPSTRPSFTPCAPKSYGRVSVHALLLVRSARNLDVTAQHKATCGSTSINAHTCSGAVPCSWKPLHEKLTQQRGRWCSARVWRKRKLQ